jgi:hypothetical protein
MKKSILCDAGTRKYASEKETQNAKFQLHIKHKHDATSRIPDEVFEIFQ